MAHSEDTLFASALALPASERAAFLDHECKDAALRARVHELLQAHDEAKDFLGSPVTRAPQPDQTGDRIGRYQLLQKIGEGGCGIVYMAEQEEPVRRRVALKVIKLGMDTKEVIARFAAERQALALMDHPNIAKVLDAGATAAGRPFFVMELVRGVKLTEYCDASALAIPARLQLFMSVCSAVQHAHQKGIIHRDLKPSNILVTLHDGVPVPKVIDFGIAKATQGKLTDRTLFTAFEQFVGTPAYMSPEQAELSGLDIDTRSDIYSLGVLLYELLTGRTPFDAHSLLQAGLDEIRRVIREVEPPRPSTRLSTLGEGDRTAIAKQRGLMAGHLSRLLRGDLDWIIMRCLEKDRTRRYDTAISLADDLRRHLENEPVAARPPSAVYRLQKILRRHRVAAGAMAAVFTALVAALVISLHALRRERQARDLADAAEKRATNEGRKSTQVARFLEEMLRGVGPSVALGRDTTLLREIADRTATRIDRELQGQPEIEADLRMTLGSVYEQLGEFEKAEEMFRAALGLRQSALAPGHPKIVTSSLSLAGILAERGEVAEAENLLRAALAAHGEAPGAGAPTLLAAVQQLQWRLLAARQQAGDDPRESVRTLNNIGGISLMSGNLAEAEKALSQALALRPRLPTGAREEAVSTLMNLGALAHARAQYPEAEVRWTEALALQRQLAGPDHPGIADLIMNLGALAWARRDYPAAEARFEEALAMQRRLLPAAHENIAKLLDNLGGIRLVTGDPADAERLYRDALAMRRTLFGDHSPFTAYSLASVADALEAQKQWTEAEALQREALAIREQNDPDDWNVYHLRQKLGVHLARRRQFKEAESLLIGGYAGMKQREDQIRPDFREQILPQVLRDMSGFYTETGQPALAAEWLKKLEACQRSLQVDPAGTRFP